MINVSRKELKLKEARTKLVEAALSAGHYTRKAICKATALKIGDLNNLFAVNRDLYAKYAVMRKSLANLAADNVQEILNDPNHPQHFQASKFILQNFKSDLDDELEASGGGMEIEIPSTLPLSESTTSPVVIRFSNVQNK